MKLKLSFLAATALLALSITGCGDGDDAVQPAAIAGVAVDGYLSHSNVYADINNDGANQANELVATTDENGKYIIPANMAAYKIIISGGTDFDTKASFKGVLKAPAGSKVTSPLTTLLADGMSEAEIKTIFGLSSADDIRKDFRAAGAFDAKIAKAALITQAIIGQITTSMISSGSTVNESLITKSVVDAIKANITAPAELTTKLAAVVTAVDAADTSVNLTTGNTITTISSAISASVTTVQAATLTEGSIAAVVQNVANAQLLSSGVYVKKNELTIGGQTVSYNQSGVLSSVTIPTSTDLTVVAGLFNKDQITATPKAVEVGFVIDDVNSTRELKAILKGATVSLVNSEIVVTIPTTAKLYVQGTTSSGNVVAATLNNLTANTMTSVNEVFTLNLSTLMNDISTKVAASSLSTSFANLTVAGSYAVSFYFSGITFGYDDLSSGKQSGTNILVLNAPSETLSVIDGTQTMTGLKLSGNVKVQ